MSSPNQDKQVLYIDSPLYKKTTPNGNLESQVDSNAIMNAFKIWLTSGKREIIRSKNGGYLLPYLQKPLTLEVGNDMKKNILSGMDAEFQPPLTVQQLEVIPDQTNKRWVIWLVAYSTQLNVGINDTAIINAL